MAQKSTLVAAVGALFVLAQGSSSSFAGPLEDLQPGHWYEVPNSQLRSVNPCPGDGCSYSGIEGQSAVIDDWNGGAFATGYGTKGGFIVWGGGHGGYLGNEIYVFDVALLRWVRVTDPVENPSCNMSEGELQNGSPCSAHTYDYVDYHPGSNSFVLLGSASNHLQGGGGSPRVHLFSFDTNSWRRGARKGTFLTHTGASSAYDPNRDAFWLLPAYGTPFAIYDPDANSGAGRWTEYLSPTIEIDTVSAVDPGRDLFVTVDGLGTKRVQVWDLKNPGSEPVLVTTSGDKTLQNSPGNGFEWDPVSNAFVGWTGGASVYKLTPPSGDWRTGTWVWSKINPAAGNSVVPTSPNANSTYSRWRYVPSLNVFVLYNRVSDNVFFYKLSQGGGVTDPSISFAANPTSVSAQGTTQVTWSTTSADACTASASPAFGGWSGSKLTSGNATLGPLSATTNFTLACTNTGGGSASRSVTVTVASATPAPSVTFSANPTSVAVNGSSTLSWSTSNATSCTGGGSWSGAKQVPNGSQSVGPLSAASTFTLSCTGAGGTTQKSVTVSLVSAPAVSFSADPPSVTVGERSTLTWSSQNTTGCSASGAWAGNKAASGSEQTAMLSNTSTFTLECSGSGGSTSRSVTVTAVAGGGGGNPPPPAPEAESGGGSLELWSLIALAFVLLRRRAATLMPRRMMAALGGALLLSFGGGAMADALSDFQQRASHPDVVRAISFDSAADVNDHAFPDGNFERAGSGWDQTVKASGSGSLRFTVPSNSGSDGSGSWRINFSDAPFNVQFGANEEFYVQWRQRFDSGLLTTDFQDGGGWKQVIIGEGDVTTTTEAGSCSELEIVVQNTEERGFPQMYHNCGHYSPFEQLFGAFDFKLQNAIPAPYCLYSLNPGGGITGKEPCFLYRANEWMTFQVRVKLGPRGTGSSVLGGSGIPGFINSTVQMWIAREGQPSQLVHDWSGLVLRESEGKEYGKIWLLPYHTGKSASQSHPVTHTWYDELIVSRSRIADPAASGVTNPTISFAANPTSVSAQGTTQVTWSTTAADACTASASPAFTGWSGSKLTSGNATLGPLSATTSFTLACTNTGGGSASRSATVTVASATPAPSVTFSANPTSVAMNGSSTLSWSTSNATSCTGSGGWSGAKQVPNGSQSVGPISAASTFTLSCTGAGGATQKSVTVSLVSAPAVSFSANPTSVTVGERSTLTWSSQNATGCSASGAWAGNKAASGSEQSGTLNNTSTFTLDCSGSGGTTSRSVTVTAVAGGGGGNPPPAPEGESGGGSLGLWTLIALAASALRRRSRRRPGLAAAVS